MASVNNLGFFSSFNARHLGAEEVARMFVPSSKFRQLAALQNSVLVGARGSGKTHLLKMLQPKALGSWVHEAADEIRQQIGFWGVFVPADEAWRQQIDSTVSEFRDEIQNRFRTAMFTAHIQRSVVDCFLQLTYDRPANDIGFAKVDLLRQDEFELSKNLAQTWNLNARVNSLLGIRQAIVERCADLYEATSSEASAREILEVYKGQAIQSALRGINAFDTAVKRFDGRWCLMFDELEIAPPEIQQVLFRSLRASDQRLVFKLALSPSTQAASVFREAVGPTAGNDFEEISLYADPKESAAFCESLWNNLAQGTSARNLSPTSVLGHSAFYENESAPYSKNGRWQDASSSLAKKDPSYRDFMARYYIDPDSLATAPPKLRDSVVRKIAPIVGFRDFMLKWDPKSETALRRLDKTRPSRLFSGWEALCLVSEGNPRWFTGIAKTLLIKRETSPSQREISKETQYAALTASAKKFLDYIATIPSKPLAHSDSDEAGLKVLLSEIVKQFREEIIFNDFALDPPLSFQVDADVSEDVRQAIFDGLYSGAFIPVGDIERHFAFSRDLIGQRLRPTYLIAPIEILPLRTGKARMLSTLLKRSARSRSGLRPRRLTRIMVEVIGSAQEKLFNE